jgi:hypothetical protein
VIREISRAPEPRKLLIEGLLKQINPLLLDISVESMELAERYIKEGIIPVRYRSDALHIAIAVTNGIDALISWNFEHIVRLKTRVMVNGINKLLGYHEIEICSPQEVKEKIYPTKNQSKLPSSMTLLNCSSCRLTWARLIYQIYEVDPLIF